MKMENKKSNTILVFRFSAFGDVAMTVPVITEFLQQNADVRIIYVSREKFKDLFISHPNFQFYAADLDGKHKGIFGLYTLAKELKAFIPAEIADIHNVLRTKILRFFLFRIKSRVLNKAREERKALIRTENKVKKQLKPMAERYADVFRFLGYDLKLSHQLPIKEFQTKNAIGIAPYALHDGKMYPLDKMRTVALKIAETGIKVYLFGGGSKEKYELESWEKDHENIESVVGKLNLNQELDLIKKLKLMVSMDSANMHLASLVGTPVVSIWGTTHPFMGFLGYGQSMDNVLQDESLEIRPTSVFGKEPKGLEKIDYFQNIPIEMVVNKIKETL